MRFPTSIRAAHYFCAPFLSAVAVTMELALFIGSILGGVGRTGSAQMICLCVASVSAAAAFFMCETLASGVVAGLLMIRYNKLRKIGKKK